jgi:hypothetical protein
LTDNLSKQEVAQVDLTSNPPAPATAPVWRAKWASFVSRFKPRPGVRDEQPLAPEVSGALRAFRAAALWGLAVLVATADGAAFSESYRGLFEWAEHHGFGGFWAAAFPLQVDVFIVAGEVVLFIAMIDHWNRRDRLSAWLVALLGLAVSIAGNVGHIAAHDLQSRGTAAVPPVAAFGALWLGLGVLKRILRRRQATAETVARNAQQAAERDALAETLAGLAGAVRSLADKAAEPVRDDAQAELITGRLTEQGAILSELTAMVKELRERPADATWEPVPGDVQSAAFASYRRTYLAGNPWPQRQMEIRFGTTRAQFAEMRERMLVETGAAEPAAIRYAEPLAALNGSAP